MKSSKLKSIVMVLVIFVGFTNIIVANVEICKEFAKSVKLISIAHQRGIPKNKIISEILDAKFNGENLLYMLKTMDTIYNSPIIDGAGAKKAVSSLYELGVMKACLESIANK